MTRQLLAGAGADAGCGDGSRGGGQDPGRGLQAGRHRAPGDDRLGRRRHRYPARRARRPRVVGPQRARARTPRRKLAKAGYVAFALDMYGKGKVATHPDDAMKFMSEATQGSRRWSQARFDAALAELKSDPHVDAADRRDWLLLRRRRRAEHGAAGRAARRRCDVPRLPRAHLPAKRARSGQAPGADGRRRRDDSAGASGGLQEGDGGGGRRRKVIVYPGAKHSFTNPDADKAGMPQLRVQRRRRCQVVGGDARVLQEDALTRSGGLRSTVYGLRSSTESGPRSRRAIPEPKTERGRPKLAELPP